MADADRWRRIEELFHGALDRPDEERNAWLDEACASDGDLRRELASLLESDRAAAGGFVGATVEQAVIELGDDLGSRREGRRLGPYRLIRELGRGGMGAVYLAARDDQEYESEVAIKLVRPGLDSEFIMRRFRRERQILARLHHANIAGLFDGGTADDGSPYIVMEYIEGSWITTYATQHKLTIDERLRLFLPVCAAVEHAHRHFIVHRDLKPGNILIDNSGAPKLLDFGVSKLLLGQPDASETQDVGLMTPDYASPEQIAGDPVTVGSDVYSLGAVLYELLTGVRPHRIEQRTPLALERAICYGEVIPPSAAVESDRSLARRLAGDLDNIILCAMHKEPERRYPSVEQMDADIRRHLDHQPIAARPDSLTYRTGKFVRRNRVSVALGSLVLASLIGGTAFALREARNAQARFQDVRTLATTFVFDVEAAVRELPGSLRVRQLIARTGLEYLGNLARNSGDDPALKREVATAYVRIGELQGGVETANLGDPPGALASFEQARNLLDEVLKRTPTDRMALLDRMTVAHRLGDLHREMGYPALALEALEDGLRRAEAFRAFQPNDPDGLQYAAVFHLDLSRLQQRTGNLERAARELESGIGLLGELSTARPDDRATQGNIAVSHARLGAIEAELGHRNRALASYRAGASVFERLLQRFPDDTHVRRNLMLGYSHIGDLLGNPAYDNAGDSAGAIAAYTKMVNLAKVLHDAERTDVRATRDYGIALLRLGVVSPPDAKRATLEQSLGLLQLVAGRTPQDTPNAAHAAWAALELGDWHRDAGDGRASQYYALALSTADAVLKTDASDTACQRWLVTAARELASEQIRAGETSAALTTINTAIRLGERMEATAAAEAPAGRSNVARAWRAAGFIYAALADRERGTTRNRHQSAARAWYRRSMQEWRRLERLDGFTSSERREMDSTGKELAALDRRSTS